MSDNVYRPLIKLTNTHDTYLPLLYAYQLNQIAKIKKYLTKRLTFVGVDAPTFALVENDKTELERQKIKIKAVNGQSTTTNSKLQFYKDGDLDVVVWDNIFLCLNMPYNSKQDPSDYKEQIDSKLSRYIENHLIFRNKSSGKLLDRSSINALCIGDLDLFFQPTAINPQNFDTHYRQIRFVLPIVAILAKKQGYSPKQIYEAIEEDVLSSIKILIKNKLSIRIIKRSSNQGEALVLQSFVESQNQQQAEGNKLSQILNRAQLQERNNQQQQIQALEQKEKGTLSEQLMANPHRRDLSNRSLILILGGMLFLYAFLKLNPLEKLLNDGL